MEKDREYIITQVLNYGDWNGVKWLKNVYGEDIKQIVEHPSRGQWFDRTLNFWEQMFNIKIDPHVRKRAIFDVNPNYEYTVEDFKEE